MTDCELTNLRAENKLLAEELEKHREAIRRLADQDATLSVVGGNVIVEMDATLRDTFAAAALTGLLSSLPNGDQYHSFAVEKAWSLADAMLCERRRCPVSSQENFTLTDEERFVLREVRDIYADEDDVKCNEIAAVIDGLLERTK
jgi:hypothetical protein